MQMKKLNDIVKKVGHLIGYKICVDCDGLGVIEMDDMYYGEKISSHDADCPTCKGRGYLYK